MLQLIKIKIKEKREEIRQDLKNNSIKFYYKVILDHNRKNHNKKQNYNYKTFK